MFEIIQERSSRIFLVLIFHCLLISPCFANNYSNNAILMYNEAAALQNQGKLELAEQKYNQVLKIQPDFVEVKNNLAIIYKNYANKSYDKGEYAKAVAFSKKALSLNANKTEVYETMGSSYLNLKDYENAVKCYNKLIQANPNDVELLHLLAQTYIKANQTEKAAKIYQKILQMDPSDKVALNNLKYTDYKAAEQKLDESLDNLTVAQNAPKNVYALLLPEQGVPKEDLLTMKKILDLTWSEPSGKLMLQELVKKHVFINIILDNSKANTTATGQKQTIYAYGILPLATFNSSTVSVNIPVHYIEGFNNPNLSAHKRVYNLQVFIHELGHAFNNLKTSNNYDSLEEEVGVSMIGYNIASKVLTGQYLTEAQARSYGLNCLMVSLRDEHSALPVFSGFNKKIQKYGIVMPYPQTYSDLPSMYKKLLSEGRVTPVQSFSKYMK